MKQFISKHEKLAVILYIVITFAVSRIILYLISGISFGTFLPSDFLVRMNRWDAIWYTRYVEDIVDGGLRIIDVRGEASWAFFPMYPLILAAIWKLVNFKHSVFLIGSAVSSVFFMAFEYVAYRYILLTRKSLKQACWYIFFMTFGFCNFYFSITYTESIYLFLLSLCFLLLYKKKYVWMGIVGAILSFTRVTGVLFVFVIIIKLIVDYINSDREKKSVGGFFADAFSNAKLILGGCLFPLGIFVYMLYLKWLTGDAFAFKSVQISWGRGTGRNIFQIFWDEFTSTYPPSPMSIFVLLSVVLIVLAVINKKSYAEMILPLLTLIINCMSSLASSPRYMIGSFTMVLAFTDFFMDKNKPTKAVIFTVVMMISLVTSYWWLKGSAWLC